MLFAEIFARFAVKKDFYRKGRQVSRKGRKEMHFLCKAVDKKHFLVYKK